MPRVQSTSTPPTYEQVREDVKRHGPLTAAYAETVARKMGLRHSSGDLLQYKSRRDRGGHFLRGLVATGKLAEDDLVAAVAQFAADKATEAERATILPHFDYRHT